jgi:hypothetical protein
MIALFFAATTMLGATSLAFAAESPEPEAKVPAPKTASTNIVENITFNP